jgi:hypothetical protein
MKAEAMGAPSFAALLRAVWPRNTAKAAARAAGVSHRTSGKWVYEGNVPSADTLLTMIAESQELREELLHRLGEAGYAGTEHKDTRRTMAPPAARLGRWEPSAISLTA